MATFSTNPYFIIFQCLEWYTTLIVKELFYNKKNKFFTSISKSIVTYITITETKMSNNNKIILQYIKNIQSSRYCQKETV